MLTHPLSFSNTGLEQGDRNYEAAKQLRSFLLAEKSFSANTTAMFPPRSITQLRKVTDVSHSSLFE